MVAAVLRAGARPVLADCDPQYQLLDPDGLRARLTRIDGSGPAVFGHAPGFEQGPQGGPVADAELAHDGGDMAPDGRRRQEQLPGDVGRGETLEEQLEDVRLPAGEGGGPGRVPVRMEAPRASQLPQQPGGDVPGDGGLTVEDAAQGL